MRYYNVPSEKNISIYPFQTHRHPDDAKSIPVFKFPGRLSRIGELWQLSREVVSQFWLVDGFVDVRRGAKMSIEKRQRNTKKTLR